MAELGDMREGRSEGAAHIGAAVAGSPPPSLPWRLGGGLLLVTGLSASAAALYLVGSRRSPDGALWLWLLALASLPVGLNFGVRNPLHLARPRADGELAIVVCILTLAALLRVATQPLLPWMSHGPDESAVVEFQGVLRGDAANPFAFDSAGEPYLSYLVGVPFARLTGDESSALLWGSAVEGLLSILLLHLVVRRLVPARIAALAALLLALLPWHVHLSRGSLVEMQALVAPLLLFYLILRAMDSQRPIEYLLAGYAAGLSLLFPQWGRVGPAVVLLYILYSVSADRAFLKVKGRGLLVAVLGTLVFVGPFLL